MDRAVHIQMRDEIRRDIAAMESQLEQLRAAEQYHASKAGPDPRGVHEAAHEAAHAAFACTLDNVKIWVAAQSILRDAGKPMTAPEIAEEMIRRGYKDKDRKSLRNTLFSAMHTKPDVFRKEGPGLWWLKEQVANGN
jgi:hypothetical protein